MLELPRVSDKKRKKYYGDYFVKVIVSLPTVARECSFIYKSHLPGVVISQFSLSCLFRQRFWPRTNRTLLRTGSRVELGCEVCCDNIRYQIGGVCCK